MAHLFRNKFSSRQWVVSDGARCYRYDFRNRRVLECSVSEGLMTRRRAVWFRSFLYRIWGLKCRIKYISIPMLRK